MFRVIKVRIEDQGNIPVLGFSLDQEKVVRQNGRAVSCAEIVFFGDDRAELKSLLMSFFDADRLFDFSVDLSFSIQDKQCRIKGLERFRQ